MPAAILPAVVILAGGKASRIGGGDKGQRRIGNRSILECIVERMRGQGSMMLLNANGEPARFDAHGIAVIADSIVDSGPLAGILAGMEWVARHHPDVQDIVTVPTDTPFLPEDLVARLIAARESSGSILACAASGGRYHPVIALFPVRLAPMLRRALVEGGVRAVQRWMGDFPVAAAEFATIPLDPFYNINTPADLAVASAIAL